MKASYDTAGSSLVYFFPGCPSVPSHDLVPTLAERPPIIASGYSVLHTKTHQSESDAIVAHKSPRRGLCQRVSSSPHPLLLLLLLLAPGRLSSALDPIPAAAMSAATPTPRFASPPRKTHDLPPSPFPHRPAMHSRRTDCSVASGRPTRPPWSWWPAAASRPSPNCTCSSSSWPTSASSAPASRLSATT